MNLTKIEWTHRPGTVGMTWNPIRARNKETGRTGTFCTHASTGCLNCYAEAIGKRFGTGLAFNVPNLKKIDFFLDEKILGEPLKRKKPATIFVAEMFDLLHDSIPQEFIAEVLRVAVKTPRHTYQFLTKRAERMKRMVSAAQEHWGLTFPAHMWFGVSVEDQQRADERIPLLLETPAALRFLSVEPQLEAVDLTKYWDDKFIRGISWVIVGGESGHGARPFNLAWAESLRDQCKASNVAFFMKQVGSRPLSACGCGPLHLEDRKGGDPSEWPEALRVREFPMGGARHDLQRRNAK